MAELNQLSLESHAVDTRLDMISFASHHDEGDPHIFICVFNGKP
jgi:hypothetical protein